MEPKVLLNPKRWEKLLIFWDISMIRPGPKGDQFRIKKNSGRNWPPGYRLYFREKYELHGALTAITSHKNNLLLLESFSYYFQLPSMYSKNELVSRYSFLIFIMNTALVITWAIVTQVVLCGITAFPISRLLPKKSYPELCCFFSLEVL